MEDGPLKTRFGPNNGSRVNISTQRTTEEDWVSIAGNVYGLRRGGTLVKG